MESQNTYLEASGHAYDLELHKNAVSKYPLPQHPLFTTSIPTKRKKEKKNYNTSKNKVVMLKS